MVKEEKPIFVKVILVMVVILIANSVALFYRYGDSSMGFTGAAISENATKIFTGMSGQVKIFLIAQWSILSILVLAVLIRDSRVRRRNKEVSGINLEKMSSGSKTDMDTLYKILKDKKQVRISTIRKSFKIDKDTAMQWSKILESGNLAVVDYSSAEEPVLKLVE